MNYIAAVSMLLVFLEQFAVAQYNFTYTNPVQDMTSWITTGTNAWQYLPGNPQCTLGSASLPSYKHVWCVGMDHYPYDYNPKTKAWTKQTAMGTASTQMVVKDSQHVYALQSLSNCAAYAPDQNLMKWTGSAWVEVLHDACWSGVGIAQDGFMTAVLRESGTYHNTMWYSTDGTHWVQWSPGGIGAWVAVNMYYQSIGCAVSAAGSVYEVGNVANATTPDLGNPSTHPLVGCIALPWDSATVVWDSVGKVWIDLEDNTGWHSVPGLTVNQIVGMTKPNLVALDTTGKPYHLAVLAKSLTITDEGTWNSGCPGPSMPCHSGTTHSLKVQVKAHNGNGLNSGAGQQVTTMAWNAYGKSQSWDTILDASCDPFYGDPTQPGCGLDNSGENVCNQSGQGLGSPLPMYGEGVGDWYVSKTNLIRVVFGTLTEPFPGTWYQSVAVPVEDNCLAGTPTCRNIPQININPPVWDMVTIIRGHDPLKVAAGASAFPDSGPWVLESYYQIDPYLAPQCFPKTIRPQDAADDQICD